MLALGAVQIKLVALLSSSSISSSLLVTRQCLLMTEEDKIRKRLSFMGALLFLIGMATGIWSAVAITQKFGIGEPKLALAAHLNALLGGLWLIVAAWSFQFLHYSVRGLRRLSAALAAPAWANWLITLIASFLGVNGLDYTGHRANDIIAFLLQTLVVLPTLVVCGFWVWGFKEKR
ncbi:MAG: hypothetical protein DMF64_09830 [Acidobacteria bacterium]|nr:MAG: hypothetical protein DMF64_09830 [Acidobacteriota bacterium]